ncbi:PHB depolymerase family esterase [Corynebacterium sp. MSK044]|uniref:alpha/beta hydrolase family esterase n=1 Tax=Corynebacterium sp. MSK044 TaxID=3050195 RepID=UPI00254D626E|nr:PHB depolymerase family esterase [Corynebacterium sp. MSK044]MDK8796622.1 PHB depolymerase family esterase [Corynebacterium sp. MSK044]
MPHPRSTRTVTVDVPGHGTQQFSYHCSVPSTAHNGEPLPLIVGIHGKGDNGYDFLIGTNLGVANAVVVTPTGQGLAWSPAPYAITTVEQDTALIEAIIADISSAYSIDPQRVYLAGFSNGGGLVAVLATNNPDKYAGAATVAGAIRSSADELAAGSPIDYLNIHGTWDDVVPYAGENRGGGGVIQPARDVATAFAERNGDQARTAHIPVEGMGHEWPAGIWARSRGIDVTEIILDFFGITWAEH